MSSRVPPIESGYRGSRMKATLEQNSSMTNNFCLRNNISNNNPGRPTYVATNLRSYFSPPGPNTTTKHQDCNQGHGSNRQWPHSAHDRHARWGSRWADSEAARRFRAQSVQFDTSTKSFLKNAHPSASQLILAIHSESRSPQNRKKQSSLAALAYQISQHEWPTQNQISQHIGDFMQTQIYGQTPQGKPDDCIQVIMENFNSLGIFTKGTKINSLNKLCRRFNTNVLAGCKT